MKKSDWLMLALITDVFYTTNRIYQRKPYQICSSRVISCETWSKFVPTRVGYTVVGLDNEYVKSTFDTTGK